jgi:PhnB protein
MATLNAYIFFNGNCAEAMRFYQRTFGGKLDLMKYSQMPPGNEPPPEEKIGPDMSDKIMHAYLEFDGNGLMASDEPNAEPREGSKGFSLTLTYPNSADARRMFDVLSEGGRVTMPFAKTFWSDGFGMLVDRFGTPWFINTAAAQAKASAA